MTAQSQFTSSNYTKITDARFRHIIAVTTVIILTVIAGLAVTVYFTRADGLDHNIALVGRACIEGVAFGFVVGLLALMLRILIPPPGKLLVESIYAASLLLAVVVTWGVCQENNVGKAHGQAIVIAACVATAAGVTLSAFMNVLSQTILQLSSHAQIYYFNRESARLQARLREAEDEKRTLTATHDSLILLQGEVDEKEAELPSLRQQVGEKSDHHRRVRDEHADLTTQSHEIDAAVARTKREIASHTQHIGAASTELTQLQARAEGLGVERDAVESERDVMQSVVKRAESDLDQVGLSDRPNGPAN